MTRSTRAVLCLLALLALGVSCGDDSTGVRVPADIILIPNQPVIGQGLTLQLSGTVVDAAGRSIPGRSVRFSSDNPSVVTITAAGLMTSVGPLGSALITAEDDGLTDTVRVLVRQRVMHLTVTPTSIQMHRNTTKILSFDATDFLGNHVFNVGLFSFTSSKPSVVTVSQYGEVTAVGPTGTATITVAVDGIQIKVPVTVYLVATRVQTTPGNVVIRPGGSKQLVSEVLDSLGDPIAGRSVTYVNHDPSLFSLSAAGLLTSIAGTGRGSLNAKSGSLTLLVPVFVTSGMQGVRAATTPVAGAPYGVAVGPGGETYVGLLNTSSFVQGTLPGYALGSPQTVGNLPLGMAINPAGTRAYVALGDDLAVGVIDVTSNQVLPPITGLGSTPYSVGVSPDNKTIFIGTDQKLYFADASTNQLTDSLPASFANFMVVHPTLPRLYVSMAAAGMAVEVNTGTRTIIRTYMTNGSPMGLGLSPAGTELYVSNEAGYLQVWNISSGLQVKSVPLASAGFGLGVTANELIVAETGGIIEILDRATLQQRTLLNTGGTPRRVGVNRAGTVAVVTNEAGWVDFIE